MRRILLLSAVALATLATLASCKKEQSSAKKFYATIENADKTNFNIEDGVGVVTWDEYDEVNINGFYFEARDISSDGKTAILYPEDPESATSPTSPYWAVYPADIRRDGDFTIVLDWDRDYDEYNPANVRAPMCAYSDGSTNKLYFKNLCGMIVLRLQSDSKKINYISFDADRPISDDFYVEYINGEPKLTPDEANSYELDINCRNPVDIRYPTNFYIYIPPAEYGEFSIKIGANDGTWCTYQFQRSDGHDKFVVERSKYHLLEFNIPSEKWE